MAFPGATHTFTVKRKGALINDPDNAENQIPSPTPATVHTGLSIQIKPLLGLQVINDGGVQNQGKFQGLTFSGTDIRDNDTLHDETANATNGKPVGYTVTLAYDNSKYLQLFLSSNIRGA